MCQKKYTLWDFSCCMIAVNRYQAWKFGIGGGGIAKISQHLLWRQETNCRGWKTLAKSRNQPYRLKVGVEKEVRSPLCPGFIETFEAGVGTYLAAQPFVNFYSQPWTFQGLSASFMFELRIHTCTRCSRCSTHVWSRHILAFSSKTSKAGAKVIKLLLKAYQRRLPTTTPPLAHLLWGHLGARHTRQHLW